MPNVTQPAIGWQLDGDSAAAYERFLVPAIFDQFARDLVDLAAPAPGERVLDVACGTVEIGSEAWPSPAELLRREAASSPLAGAISALAAPARDALIDDLAQALRDYTDDERVVFPIETHFATGRR